MSALKVPPTKRGPRQPIATSEWQGFTATAHSLDAKRVLALPLKQLRTAPDGQQDIVLTTIAEVFQELADRPIEDSQEEVFREKDEVVFGERYVTSGGDIVVGGARFNRDVLQALLDFRKDGINALFETNWFWYDCEAGPEGEPLYSFFVVHNAGIVRDAVSFFGDSAISHDSGFTPSVFTADGDGDFERWSLTLERRSVARDRFWYRKFYQETRAGQLMVLRPDQPELHHFPEGRWRPDLAFAVLQHRLGVALWLLGLLAMLGLLHLWR